MRHCNKCRFFHREIVQDHTNGSQMGKPPKAKTKNDRIGFLRFDELKREWIYYADPEAKTE